MSEEDGESDGDGVSEEDKRAEEDGGILEEKKELLTEVSNDAVMTIVPAALKWEVARMLFVCCVILLDSLVALPEKIG